MGHGDHIEPGPPWRGLFALKLEGESQKFKGGPATGPQGEKTWGKSTNTRHVPFASVFFPLPEKYQGQTSSSGSASEDSDGQGRGSR